ncbi:hypothetical protein ACH5RR_023237 [Cinchona calisaya]|uniref:Uncharacterized protein n=1 Tax=Cinchona calisaya TaxID=153742 RepID=A0ABD2ZA35_9GENT
MVDMRDSKYRAKERGVSSHLQGIILRMLIYCQYERLQIFCYFYDMIRYSEKDWEKKILVQVPASKDAQYGPWMCGNHDLKAKLVADTTLEGSDRWKKVGEETEEEILVIGEGDGDGDREQMFGDKRGFQNLKSSRMEKDKGGFI